MNSRVKLVIGIGRYFVLAALLGVFGMLAFHSAYTPYQRNLFHKHRWTTEACKAAGVPIEHCAMPVQSKQGEVHYFEFCLEHGEFRWIK